MPKSKQWKYAENKLVDYLREENIPAFRVDRSGNWGKSDTDAKITDALEYKFDSKYTVKGWRHHRLIQEVQYKYCKEVGDIPILFTKTYKERDDYITIPVRFFTKLLRVYLEFNKFDFEAAWQKLTKSEK